MAVYFLSDLHLGAPYFPDSRESEKRVVAFLDKIKDDAETIYLLGDVLDYWFEYRYVVPRGFVRFFGKLAELADSGIRIVWMKGNHDIWIYDYLPSELGVEVYDGEITQEIYGKKYFLAHGDGLGKRPWTFRILRKIFRSKTAQKAFSGIHPRWTVPFAYNWSRHSRKRGEYPSLPEKSLLKGLRDFSKSYSEVNPEIDCFVYGHIHILARETIAPGKEMVVLGEWIKTFSYVKLTEYGMEVSKWSIG